MTRHRRRLARLATAFAAALAAAALPSVAPAGAAVLSQSQPDTNCRSEQYPAANAPANAPSTPYELPFTAHITQGEFSVTGTKGLVLQLGAGRTLSAELCGLLSLPSQSGAVTGNPGYGAPGNNHSDQYNDNIMFDNPIPVALFIPGVPVPLMEGYGAAEGAMTTQIQQQPAPNGGLNVDLYGSDKATADLQGIPGLPGGSECTVAVGDLVTDGLPAQELATLGTPPPGSAYTGPNSLVHFTTGTSGANGHALSGQPVTGPITNGQSIAVSDSFVVAPISPYMPPAPGAPNASSPPSSLCSPTVASAFNSLVGLPAPAGNNWFSAPTAFAINVCGEVNPDPPHQPLVPACNPHPFG